MKLLFENQSGSSFEIEVDDKDTVLEVKQKIEKSQRIPVSKQTLSFDGIVLQDDFNVEKCKMIVHESRIQLFVSPPPSNSTEQIIDGHDDQDSTVMAQTDQSPPPNPTEHVTNPHQDSTVPSQVPQSEQSSPSNSAEVMTTNIQDSYEKERIRKKRMVVHVMPYSGENKAAKRVPVAVNVNDNVKELRNELVKIEERGVLNLPQGGYFLIHKNRVLNENQSFWVAGVDNDDKIDILPTHLTRGSFNLDS